MTRTVEVRTPARLHFGLSSFGGPGRQFSGLGLMVDEAGITLHGSPAEEFVTSGPHADRVEAFARNWADHQHLSALPAVRLEVVNAPPDHVGLGIGTQLGLAVAAALSVLFNVEYRDAATLAQMSGRGRRSAIGTHGFLHGGLLVDAGKLPDDPLGTLQTRFEMPTPWRFVLIREPAGQGLAGKAEQTAISSLPPVASEVTESLHTLISAEILQPSKPKTSPHSATRSIAMATRRASASPRPKGGPSLHRQSRISSSMSAHSATQVRDNPPGAPRCSSRRIPLNPPRHWSRNYRSIRPTSTIISQSPRPTTPGPSFKAIRWHDRPQTDLDQDLTSRDIGARRNPPDGAGPTCAPC